MNDQDQLNEPDYNGAYTHVTAVSMTEPGPVKQNDILPRSLQQPPKAFEDFRGPIFPSISVDHIFDESMAVRLWATAEDMAEGYL